MKALPADADRPLRLFLALWPDAAVRRQLAAWRDAWRWPASAVPVQSQRLHLTLHFIGNVPRQNLTGLIRQLDVAMTPFDLSLDHGEVWRGGVAVLQPQVVPPPLLELHDILGKKLTACGLPTDERPLRPHVTLARHALGAEPPRYEPKFRWRVASYVLMRSVPDTAEGYQRLAEFG